MISKAQHLIAAIVNPDAFLGTSESIHTYCSPLSVEVVQDLTLKKAGELLSLPASPIKQLLDVLFHEVNITDEAAKLSDESVAKIREVLTQFILPSNIN